MSKQIVKVQFMRNGIAGGREYSYYAERDIVVGDIVYLPAARPTEDEEYSKGLVTLIGVSEEEVAGFADKMKTVVGRVPEEPKTAEEDEDDDIFTL